MRRSFSKAFNLLKKPTTQKKTISHTLKEINPTQRAQLRSLASSIWQVLKGGQAQD